jgi:hypothetical protein
MDKEIDYYRTASGLAAGKSLYDYQYKYFQTQTGLPVGSTLDDMKSKFYGDATGLYNNDDAEYQWLSTQLSDSSRTKSVKDLWKKFFDINVT